MQCSDADMDAVWRRMQSREAESLGVTMAQAGVIGRQDGRIGVN